MDRTVKTNAGDIRYELLQTQRKSMEIRIDTSGLVRLFAPRRVPLRMADGFILERADWICFQREQLKAHRQRMDAQRPIQSGAQILYEGMPVVIEIQAAARNRTIFDGERILMQAQDLNQDALREQLKRWFFEQARARVSAQLDHYAPLIGKKPNRIAIRDQRTRWGSCSAKQNVNFNWKLIMAPPEALSYVVIHELCHLYEFNHSPKFWARVAEFMPDYMDWKAWLKKNGQCLGL